MAIKTQFYATGEREYIAQLTYEREGRAGRGYYASISRARLLREHLRVRRGGNARFRMELQDDAHGRHLLPCAACRGEARKRQGRLRSRAGFRRLVRSLFLR